MNKTLKTKRKEKKKLHGKMKDSPSSTSKLQGNAKPGLPKMCF